MWMHHCELSTGATWPCWWPWRCWYDRRIWSGGGFRRPRSPRRRWSPCKNDRIIFIHSFLFVHFKPFSVCSDFFCFPVLQGSPGHSGWPGPKGQKGEKSVATQRGAVYPSFHLISNQHQRYKGATKQTMTSAVCACSVCICVWLYVCVDAWFFCVCLRMCVYHYRISWRPRASWARWGAGSTGCSRPNRFAWFPWEPRSSSELTVISIMTVS